MIVTKEQILQTLQPILADRTDDDALKLIEDVTDTLTDLETRATSGGAEWQAKYETERTRADDLAAKYRARFFSAANTVVEDHKDDVQKDSTEITFDDLFNQKEV